MSRLTRLAAASAVAASLAAAAPAPAVAGPASCSVAYVPGCVDYAFDAAQAGIETARWVVHDLWSAERQQVCNAYVIITGDPCPVGPDR